MEPNAPAGDAAAAPQPGTVVQPTAPVDNQPAAPANQPDAAEQADNQEWDAAADELFPGVRARREKDREPAKPEKTAEEIAAEKANKDGKKPDAGKGTGDDTAAKGGQAEGDGDKPADAAAEEASKSEPSNPALEARNLARQEAQAMEVMRGDVKTKLYPKYSDKLVDKNGEAINNVNDVMQYENPATGENFTAEEALLWLGQAQRQFDQDKAAADARIEQISQINVDVGLEAQAVTQQYGNIIVELNKTPEGQKILNDIKADFEKALTVDPETQVITAMPLSLKKFYDRALAPYVSTAQKVETDAKAATDAAAAEAAKKADDEQKRLERRADRSDVFAPGAARDKLNEEDAEWDGAIKAVFPQLKK